MDENAEPQEELSPQEVLQASVDRFSEINEGMGPGMPRVQIDPKSELEAAQNALVLLLVEKGILGEEEFIGRKQLAWADLIDHATDVAKEQKRQILAQALMARPGEFSQLPGRNGG